MAEFFYPWPRQYRNARKLAQSFQPPRGFRRIAVSPDSFAAWLRGLPMKPPGSKVRLHSGALKWRQDVHAGVIDIDTGRRDLQQCADAAMRLRAEYLLASGKAAQISFNDTGAARAMTYARWQKGYRPRQRGKRLIWSKRAAPNSDYKSFRRYLTIVFAYAGTYSLSQELRKVALADMRIGDVFIQGGFPGHAVLVADMVQAPASGEKRFLLIQSFMPAQDMHVLKNLNTSRHTAWYPANFNGPLITPEWTFPTDSLRRWTT